MLGLVLLAACGLGPGLVVARAVRWSASERFVAAVGVSLVVVGLGSFAIFALGLPMGWHWGLEGACVLLTGLCWGEVRRLWRCGEVRRMVWGLGVIWVWIALVLLLIRHYGGGRWWGDWFGHYERSAFFLGGMPRDFQFLGAGLITNRPPLMNWVCAHGLSMTTVTFENYQWLATFLNMLVVLPCWLFAASVLPRARPARAFSRAMLILIFVANPMFVENVTFTWTKAFAAFYAVLGLWFYLRGWTKADRSRIVAGFFFVTAGCLVHMYVAAELLVITGHYLAMVLWRRGERAREVAAIAGLCGGLLACWVGWVVRFYGWRSAVAPDLATVYPTGVLPWRQMFPRNVYWTIVPYFLRGADYHALRQVSTLGWARDLAFDLYQTNVIFAMGSVGAVVLFCAIVARVLRWDRWSSRLRWFWVVYIPATILIALAALPMEEQWGAAQLCMEPLVFVGIAVVAGLSGGLTRARKGVLVGGCCVDFVLGVLLQAHLENKILGSGSAGGQVVGGGFNFTDLSNYQLKVQMQWLNSGFVGDRFGSVAWMIEVLLVLMFCVLWARVLRRERGAIG